MQPKPVDTADRGHRLDEGVAGLPKGEVAAAAGFEHQRAAVGVGDLGRQQSRDEGGVVCRYCGDEIPAHMPLARANGYCNKGRCIHAANKKGNTTMGNGHGPMCEPIHHDGRGYCLTKSWSSSGD